MNSTASRLVWAALAVTALGCQGGGSGTSNEGGTSGGNNQTGSSSSGGMASGSSSSGAGGSTSSGGTIQEGYVAPDPTQVDVGVDDGHGTNVLPPPEAVQHDRGRRRMDLDQLNASLRLVTGGIGWTETRGSTEVDLFVDLSKTLGKPDFVDMTTEDLEPSAIFLKFMDDAARSVCGKLLTRETSAEPGEHTFFINASPNDTIARNPDAVNRNLSALLLRFHGRRVAPDSGQLEHWRWLMRSIGHVNPGQPLEAWRGVCVGLITHPDFYSY